MQGKEIAGSPKMGHVRPVVQETDYRPNTNTTVVMAINQFNVRLADLKAHNAGWNDRRNQRRPFKDSFIQFVTGLVARLPVVPDMYPTRDGNILLKYTKTKPRDCWQTLEFLILPQRSMQMTCKSRLPKTPNFERSNMARADIIADTILAFYNHDSVKIKDHPVSFRKATTSDIPAISMLVQSHLGCFAEYASKKIAPLMTYCYVAEDPMYGIVSVAGLGETEDSSVLGRIYAVNFIITQEPFRGYGFGGRCLRLAVHRVLEEVKGVEIVGAVRMAHDEVVDDCQALLRRSGFHRVKIVKNEGRYRDFRCSRCNLDQCLCDLSMANQNCSTVYYKLGDKGGRAIMEGSECG